MSTSNAQRFLSKGGVDDELALEMFYNRVLESFHNKTLFWNPVGPDGVGDEAIPSQMVASQMVTQGKSWQFIQVALDDGGVDEHVPGTELLGQQFELDEGVITIDQILVKHYDIPVDQIQLSHFDVIAPVARKLGRGLATDMDIKLLRLSLLSARTGAKLKNGQTIHNGGHSIVRTAASVAAAYPVTLVGATNFVDDCYALAEQMDNDAVPDDGRFLTITPYIRRVLSKAPDTLFSSDFDAGQFNKLNRRMVGLIAGFNLTFPTNHMPSTAVVTGPTKYQGDFAVGGAGTGEPVSIALAGADEGNAAIGYVAASHPKVGPIYTFMGFDERRNTQFLKGQMMVGADILSPYCAGEIVVHS